MTTYHLGRHLQPNHDPRSLDHPAEVAPLVSVRHQHHGPVLDQGQLGSCTGNATAQALNTDPLMPDGRRLLTEQDAVAIYSWATHHDLRTAILTWFERTTTADAGKPVSAGSPHRVRGHHHPHRPSRPRDPSRRRVAQQFCPSGWRLTV